MRTLLVPILIVVGSGCTSDDELTRTGGAPDADPDVDLAVDEGDVGRVTVNTPDGLVSLYYTVVDGHAIHGGDLDLGPAALLAMRGGAANLGERWLDNTVRWAFDDNLFGTVCDSGGVTNCVDIRTSVRAHLAALATKIPIRFEEIGPHDGSSKVILTFGPADAIYHGKADHIGFADEEDQRIMFRRDHNGDGGVGGYHLEPTRGTLYHEMVHTLGLWHEHQRLHRDTFITIHPECIDEGDHDLPDFRIREESTDIGLYDFNSIMHYSPETYCIDEEAPFGTCDCATITANDGTPITAADANNRGGLSIEDTNTLHQMYAAGGIQRPGQKFGASLAVGDFDHDGYDDLVVGAPATKLMNGSGGWILGAGTVTVYKGTFDGPVFWRTFKQDNFSGETATRDAEFGAAVAAYDLDADGVDDLAIGAPGLGAGAVFIWRGSADRGFVQHRKLTQASTVIDTSTKGDRFGAALAAGAITGMFRLECETPARMYEALVIGAPGNLNPDGFATGAVFIFQEKTIDCGLNTIFTLGHGTMLTHTEHELAKPGDGYGGVLAVGMVSPDARADLFVGAPNNASLRGAVYRYDGRTPPESNPILWSAMATAQGARAGAKVGDEFGAALAVGSLTGASGDEVVVGAPGNSGSVAVFTAFPGLPSTTLTHLTPAPGDRFGAAVAIGPIGDPGLFDELAIGAPNRNGGDGQVMIFAGGTLAPAVSPLLDQNAGSTLLVDFQPTDHFGAAIALGHFDGETYRLSTGESGTRRGDLAIAAPGETFELWGPDYVASGVVEMVRGAIGSTAHLPWEWVLAPGIPHRL